MKNILLLACKPKQFFTDLKTEKSIKNAFITQFTTATLSFLLILILSIYAISISDGSGGGWGAFGLAHSLYNLLISLATALISTFILSFLIQFITKLFKGEGFYKDIYNVLAYSSIVCWIFLIVWYFINNLNGYNWLPFYVPSVLYLSTPPLLYLSYLTIIGISTTQNLTKTKATIIFLVPVLIFILAKIIYNVTLFVYQFLQRL